MINFNAQAQAEIVRQSLDHELAFRLRNRRNRLLGLWAAETIGLKDDEAAIYSREMVSFGIDVADEDAMVHRVAGDCAARGEAVSPEQVAAEMQRLERIAALELAAAAPVEPRAA